MSDMRIWDSVANGWTYLAKAKLKTATIAINAALSGEIDTEEFLSGALIIPVAWTAAAVTFLVSDATGGTFCPCRDQYGNEFSITGIVVNAINSYKIPDEVMTHRYIKVQSGITGTTVNQEAARALKIVLK